MAVSWKKRNIEKYPFYLPEGCNDGRVEKYKQFISDFRLWWIGEYNRIGKMGKFLDGASGYNNTGKGMFTDYPPCNYHPLIFKGDSIVPIYVYHPYYIDKNELEQWCNEREIIYCICNPDKSFYYPGRSYMVLLMSECCYFYNNSILDVIRKYETENEFPENGIYDCVH